MAIRRIRYQQEDFVWFLFFSFLVFLFLLCWHTHKEKKRKGTFGGGPGGDPSDTAVAGGGVSSSRMYVREDGVVEGRERDRTKGMGMQ